MKLFPQNIFQNSVKLHSSDTKSRNHTSYNYLFYMVFCQFTRANSLCELENSFNAHQEAHFHLKTSKIKCSTLWDTNAKADNRPFIDIWLQKNVSFDFEMTIYSQLKSY